MAKGCFSISATRVLWMLVFTGFAVNYMIRININIAIVAMVRKPQGRGSDAQLSGAAECLQGSGPTTPISNISSVTERLEVNFSSTPSTQYASRDEEGFDWDEQQQGLVLAAFFWLHWVTQLPGGMLARRLGTKLVFGLANFVPVLLSFLIPMASYWDYRALLCLRLVQGLLAGFAWPSMHVLTAHWIPPNERSKFITAYLGSSVGAALTFPLCGQLIHAWGWESAFYACGALGVVWFVMWQFLVYDSPGQHPRISQEELSYITDAIGKSVSQKKNLPTPWRAILTSRGVWMVIVAQWGGVLGLFTVMTQAPTYFRYIHGWNIRMTGFLSGLPHVMRMLWAYVFSEFGDYLLRTNKLSRTNVRKLATFFCDVMHGFLMLGLLVSGCSSTAAIVLLTAATAVHGAVSTGPLANMVDLSPNFGSIIMGITNMAAVIPGFLSPMLVGYLTYKNQTVAQWQKVFGIMAAQVIVCGLLYVFFAESELQSWNTPDTKTPGTSVQELRPLKKTDKQKRKEDEVARAGV